MDCCQWMYDTRLDSGGGLHKDFVDGVELFLEAALSKPFVVTVDDEGKKCIPCPCKKCGNLLRRDVDTVAVHLYKVGFCALYTVWHKHGEVQVNVQDDLNNQTIDQGEEMVRAVAGPDFNWDDQPTGAAKKFFDMIEANKMPLLKVNANGELKCEAQTVLSLVTQALALKSENQLSQKCYNGMLALIKSTLSSGENMPDNFYQAKRMIEGMGMEHEKIDVCPNFCMLYFGKVRGKKIKCDVCGMSRYKPPGPNPDAKPVPQKQLRYLPITPRLQRLYMTKSNAQNMMWHKKGKREKPWIMVHPADGEAWKHFCKKYPEFAKEARNVFLGLSTDGFMPFNSSVAP